MYLLRTGLFPQLPHALCLLVRDVGPGSWKHACLGTALKAWEALLHIAGRDLGKVVTRETLEGVRLRTPFGGLTK